MKILVACEYSGRVRAAFRDMGHDAWSCDLLAAEDNSPHHIHGDVLDLLNHGWDLMIAHPPCTYLTNSGVSWLYKQPERWELLNDGAAFFKALLMPDNERQRLHYLPPGPDRWKERSRTFTGIANAMAEQWGDVRQLELIA